MQSQLWAHQKNEVEAHYADSARALFWEPRLGKTRTVVHQCRRLNLRKVLVVCPKTVAPVWAQEFGGVLDLSDGPLSERVKKIPSGDGTIVVNYDSVYNLLPDLLVWDPDMVVADESHLIKRPSAKRSRALIALGRKARYRRILTGTPTPQSYRDVYSQYRFLDPLIFGTSLASFTARYLVVHPYYRNKVLGYHNLEELQSKMLSVASRLRREDALEIPQVQEVVRHVALPRHASELYARLKSERVSVAHGIDARHALTLLLRLQQITSGVLDEFATNNAKAEAIAGELEDIVYSGKKAVVFYRFKREGHVILDMLNQKEISAAILEGETPSHRRKTVISDFQNTDTLSVLVVQEQVGSLGISLTAADYAIFASCGFDYATHRQARDRIWKPKGKICYIYMVVPDTVDDFILQAINRKQSAEEYLIYVGLDKAVEGEE